MGSLLDVQQPTSTSVIFRNIVVGFDYDEPSPQTILTASALAAQHDGFICLVHATYPPIYAGYVQDLGPFVDQTLQEAKARMEDIISREPALHNRPYKIVVDIKSPVELICKTAQENSADLIVVGTHGRHSIEHFLVGSVAESLLTIAPCPVMIAGPECTACALPWKRILFATDLDNTGIRAAEYAASLSTEGHAELSVIHVMRKVPIGESDMRSWVEDGIRQRLELLFVPGLLAQLPHQLLVAYGDPVEEILAAAHSQNADLIILGTGLHGLGADHNPWRTVGRILREAHCPVLNVNATSK
jgi:nucleotide-binding universal stress UspA family protein